jgi:glycosyltransferase involved in cell wall biosynthesis
MTTTSSKAMNIVFIVHYFPPINSTGGKRVEALSKYFARMGRHITVLTTCKSTSDGAFTEQPPTGVTVLELDALGRRVATGLGMAPQESAAAAAFLPRKLLRRVKDAVMAAFGQLPDPRLPFAFGLLSPWLAPEATLALRQADVVISSMPPWPTHLAALFVRWRFKCRIVLDYRDQFSANHIMPGSPLAKWAECKVDRFLCRHASALVVVSNPMATYYSEFNQNVYVVLNGYDPEIIDAVSSTVTKPPRRAGDPVVVRYMGRMSRDRIPRALVRGVSAALAAGSLDRSTLRFECYGDCRQLLNYLTTDHPALVDMFHFNEPVPYRRAIELMLTADYLLFAETSVRSSLSAQGVLTTKLFEYLACKRPVLAEISADTEAGRLIRHAGPTHFVSADVTEFEVFLGSPAFHNPVAVEDNGWVRTLSRSSQAEQYLALLDAESIARSS